MRSHTLWCIMSHIPKLSDLIAFEHPISSAAPAKLTYMQFHEYVRHAPILWTLLFLCMKHSFPKYLASFTSLLYHHVPNAAILWKSLPFHTHAIPFSLALSTGILAIFTYLLYLFSPWNDFLERKYCPFCWWLYSQWVAHSRCSNMSSVNLQFQQPRIIFGVEKYRTDQLLRWQFPSRKLPCIKDHLNLTACSDFLLILNSWKGALESLAS